MAKFEHGTLEVRHGTDGSGSWMVLGDPGSYELISTKAMSRFGDLGLEGWQLVTIRNVPSRGEGYPDVDYHYFKREID